MTDALDVTPRHASGTLPGGPAPQPKASHSRSAEKHLSADSPSRQSRLAKLAKAKDDLIANAREAGSITARCFPATDIVHCTGA